MGDQYESGVRRLWGPDAAMTDVDMQLLAVLADLAHRHGLALAALEHESGVLDHGEVGGTQLPHW